MHDDDSPAWAPVPPVFARMARTGALLAEQAAGLAQVRQDEHDIARFETDGGGLYAAGA